MEDRTVIFVDRDPTFDPTEVTGARLGPDEPLFGADFMIDIAGKAGRVIPALSSMSQYVKGQGWRELTGQSVSAAADFHNLEAQVSLATIGLNPSVTPNTFIYTTDWRGNYDNIQPYSNRGPTASKVFAEERSVAPDTVLRGQENVPILRIDLENREEDPVEIEEVYTTIVGTVAENDIDAIRLWKGGPEAEIFDQAAFQEVSKGNVWYENRVKLEPEDGLAVEPLSASTFFVTVDISETATTLTWFDLWVLKDNGLITSSELVVGSFHSNYKLVRVWNQTGGRFNSTIGINEVFYSIDTSSSDKLENTRWVEFVNPTGSSVDLEDWTLQIQLGFTNYEIWNGSDTESITGSSSSYGYLVVYITNYTGLLKSGANLFLYDDSQNPVSYVSVGSTTTGKSWARWTKAGSKEPTGDTAMGGLWYLEDVPSPWKQNDAIPEYSDIIYPLMGTLIAYGVVRRRSVGERKKDPQSRPTA